MEEEETVCVIGQKQAQRERFCLLDAFLHPSHHFPTVDSRICDGMLLRLAQDSRVSVMSLVKLLAAFTLNAFFYLLPMESIFVLDSTVIRVFLPSRKFRRHFRCDLFDQASSFTAEI